MFPFNIAKFINSQCKYKFYCNFLLIKLPEILARKFKANIPDQRL